MSEFTLRVLSNHRVIATFPFPPDVCIDGLADALNKAAAFLLRFGPVAVVVDNPEGVSHVVGRWQ
jgi:hypothetical protein